MYRWVLHNFTHQICCHFVMVKFHKKKEIKVLVNLISKYFDHKKYRLVKLTGKILWSVNGRAYNLFFKNQNLCYKGKKITDLKIYID